MTGESKLLEERVMSKKSSSLVFQKQSSLEAHVGSEQIAGSVTTSSVSSPPAKMIKRASKTDVRNGNQCTIRLLDDNEILQCDVQSHHKGIFLMDYVCRQLNIAEKDYFGLRYVDSNKQRHWLDCGKSIVKQLKDNAYILCFRFKFYPPDPMLLKEEVTRYQLVLQLRRDLLHGRLYSNASDMAQIVSFILQSELGDFNSEIHAGNYASEYELVSRQSSELEEKAMELHQKLVGLTPSDADTLLLKKICTLETYGLDPQPVKDQHGDPLYLGVNYTGISTFQNGRRVIHYKWPQITKLNYEAKMFIIHLQIPEDSRIKKKETVGYKCPTSSACKFFWRCAVEHRLFFNCASISEVPNSVRGGGIFGSRFRYHGRVQREILEDPGPLRASGTVIQRTPLYRSLHRSKTRSLPHSPSHPGYGSLPRSNHSAPTTEGRRMEGTQLGSSTSLPLSTLSSPYCPDHTLPILETLEEDSPRVEEKGTNLVRNGSIRSTTSILSSLSIDEPDLTFMKNRIISSELEAQMLNNSEGLMSITEEREDTQDPLQKNHKAKIGNGHAFKSLNALHEHPQELQVAAGTVETVVVDPAFVVGNSTETNKSEDAGLRDTKIDQIASQLQGKTRTNFFALWKIFIICFICVILSLFCVAIMVIELDADFCRRMRHIPEVEYFQYEVYEPLKTYMRSKLHGIEHFH